MGLAIMTDSFTGNDIECVMAAADLMESLIVNCWPRALHEYKAHIIQAGALCPLNMLANDKGLAPGEEDGKASLQKLISLSARLEMVGRRE